jgi:RNA polymerase sigma factor (sigma-70 family)
LSGLFEQFRGLPLELEQDENLVQRARGGENAAFDELVRRHRLKAFSWATQLSRDPHLAEDIVQDALIRAFLHLGNLVNDARFLGWLKRIVQNQALMKLRRGGPYSREMPISTFQVLSEHSHSVDPNDLDSIMGHLLSSGYKPESAKTETDPQMSLDRQEWYIMLRSMLRCLTPRERKIFEAYFFQECSPADIAELFKISMGNVYKIISRSRQKVQQERLSFLIRAHIRQRKDDGCMKQMVLDKLRLLEAGGSFG